MAGQLIYSSVSGRERGRGSSLSGPECARDSTRLKRRKTEWRSRERLGRSSFYWWQPRGRNLSDGARSGLKAQFIGGGGNSSGRTIFSLYPSVAAGAATFQLFLWGFRRRLCNRPRFFGRAGDAKAQEQKTEALAQRVKYRHGLSPFWFFLRLLSERQVQRRPFLPGLKPALIC